MKVLVTGAAGFIGFSTSRVLLNDNHTVLGVDNLCNYYDVKLKLHRLKTLEKIGGKKFHFFKTDICDEKEMEEIILNYDPDVIMHFAAQPGVRNSETEEYSRSNIIGTRGLLELARKYEIKKFIFASSSSVYGDCGNFPTKEDQKLGPISYYAKTKVEGEKMMREFYEEDKTRHCVVFRFFTVYGSFGRPDMALYHFTERILKGKEIDVYGGGNMLRDFTHVSDIVSGIILSLKNIEKIGYESLNLGNGTPVKLMRFIQIIEECLNKKAKINLVQGIYPGDVKMTHACVDKARKLLGYEPKVSIEEGVREFVDWHAKYYENQKN